MAANTQPIYSRTGDVSNNASTGMNQLITAAANDYTGIGANNSLIFTSDATNGGFVQRVRLKPGGSNVASVMRFFINNGSTVGTATNNVFYGEISLPATTASAVQALVELDYPFNFVLPAGFRIYMGLGTAVSAGWVATVIAGKY
jgi:hypothetical protein